MTFIVINYFLPLFIFLFHNHIFINHYAIFNVNIGNHKFITQEIIYESFSNILASVSIILTVNILKIIFIEYFNLFNSFSYDKNIKYFLINAYVTKF